MKKILLALSVVAVLTACKKESNETENHCPTVAASAVPAGVVSAFKTKYPADSVITWFQKESIGYCAYFIQPVNQRKLAEFTGLGVFISEETDNDKDGKFEESTGVAGPKGLSVCECEIGD